MSRVPGGGAEAVLLGRLRHRAGKRRDHGSTQCSYALPDWQQVKKHAEQLSGASDGGSGGCCSGERAGGSNTASSL